MTDQETVAAKAGIVPPGAADGSIVHLDGGSSVLVGGVAREPASLPSITCSICYDAKTSYSALQCGHAFCNECYSTFLTHKIDDEGHECYFARCPEPKCKLIVREAFVRSLVPDGEVLARYSKAADLARSYVDDQPLLKWCPAADCTYAVKGKAGLLSAQCACQHRFCFQCMHEDHQPARCARGMLTCCRRLLAAQAVLSAPIQETRGRCSPSKALPSLRFSPRVALCPQLRFPCQVARQVPRRQRDVQLAGGQHQGLPQVPDLHREERRLQPHDVSLARPSPSSRCLCDACVAPAHHRRRRHAFSEAPCVCPPAGAGTRAASGSSVGSAVGRGRITRAPSTIATSTTQTRTRSLRMAKRRTRRARRSSGTCTTTRGSPTTTTRSSSRSMPRRRWRPRWAGGARSHLRTCMLPPSQDGALAPPCGAALSLGC